MTVRKVAIVTPAGKVVPVEEPSLKDPDLCVCGNKTRGEHGCLCENDPSPSFHFFETLMDEVDTHASSKQFYNYLIEAGLTHAAKQRDYGRPEDPFANIRSTEEWGIPGWQGAMLRLNDKVHRLQSLAQKGYLANEAAIDSFQDIAVYAIIARVLYEEAMNGSCD